MRESVDAQRWLSFSGLALRLALFTHGCCALSRGDELEIVSPVFGRPAIVAPGGALEIDLLADGTAETTVELASVRHAEHRYPLTITSQEPGASGLSRVRATIDKSIPEGQYDLHVRRGPASATRPHCVSVRRLADRLRVAVVGELRIGDPCIARFDPRLVNEINLRGPDAVLLLGGYVDPAASGAAEAWRELRGELRRIDSAVIAMCGASDSLEDFTREFGPSPIGEIAFGPHRVVAAYDPLDEPLAKNSAQQEWLSRVFAPPGAGADAGARLLMGPRTSEGLGALVDSSAAAARPPSQTGRVVAQGTQGIDVVWLRAGEDVEGAPRPTPGGPLREVRVSAALAGCRDADAGGFRVLDFSSGAAGRWTLNASEARMNDVLIEHELANDGTSTELPTRLINRTAQTIERVIFRARVAKRGESRPWVIGGRLAGLTDHHEFWETTITADLPPRAVTRVRIGSGEKPQVASCSVRWLSPNRIALRNDAAGDAHVAPIIHCNGQSAFWRWAEPPPGVGAATDAEPQERLRLIARGAQAIVEVNGGDRAGFWVVYPTYDAPPLALPPMPAP